jgi:ankyrin repeat protein
MSDPPVSRFSTRKHSTSDSLVARSSTRQLYGDLTEEGEWPKALRTGDFDKVKSLIKSGADVNKLVLCPVWGVGFPLYLAASGNQNAIAELLLEQGAKVDGVHLSSGTALQSAAWMGYDDIVRLLLDHGADVNAKGGRRETALIAAAYERRHSTIQLLLTRGADVNLVDGGYYGTALAAAPDFATTKLLIEHGADVNQKVIFCAEERTPLYYALRRTDEASVNLLLSHGAEFTDLGEISKRCCFPRDPLKLWRNADLGITYHSFSDFSRDMNESSTLPLGLITYDWELPTVLASNNGSNALEYELDEKSLMNLIVIVGKRPTVGTKNTWHTLEAVTCTQYLVRRWGTLAQVLLHDIADCLNIAKLESSRAGKSLLSVCSTLLMTFDTSLI